MNLNQFRYALAVAREHNFSRAAQRCHVSQPSLSVAIKNLEEELGIALFERFKGDVKVTLEGEAVLSRMQQALEAVEQVAQAAKQGQGGLTGEVRMGAIFTIAPYLFPSFIPQLHQVAPDLTMLLEENFTSLLSEKLKQGALDLAVVALPFEEPGITVEPLYDEPFIVGLPNNHPWKGREDLHGNALAEEKLLLLGKGHCFRDQVLEICPACHLVEDTSQGMHNIIEGSSLETIRHMVATGVGITVLPISSVASLACNALSCPERSHAMLSFAHFAKPMPTRRIALAWRSSYPNEMLLEVVKQTLQGALPNGVLPISDSA
uniref:Putative Transcriptional regulator, LysR family n=1 Tax=Magnetococcus massalia (strain MO-1) TaxID=451514 RepID=A0A1S7LMG1_MAGMO|nr:putative Transcriptional regulator, LysR family [Candidatus Magnetococcus massalia]